ncbi:DUF1993 domain-containing protein [Cognatiluteimonas telluris]|uniref:DUF1993 domain-containing protein n=1 Tax=Cognatiluteimonas telluris TaxID=1104775 RepID=UPI0014092CD5|nr:DUF1993 domain-containing protein [Lysobacter telluris]
MTISMYQASVPVFVRALQNLRAVLHKGEAHAVEKAFAPEVLLQTRLIADMLPLVRQVQIATDMAKNGACRLAGSEPPKFEDDETSFAQLYARIDRAIEVIRGIDAAQVDGSESRPIVLQMRSGEMKFEGQAYLLDFVLPNLFFHCTTSYVILREAGVQIGKMDFIGATS